MPTYLSPGVYVEEIDSGARPLEGVGQRLPRSSVSQSRARSTDPR